MRTSTIAYIVGVCAIIWALGLQGFIDCWRDDQARARILAHWTRWIIYFTYYVNYLLYSRYVEAYFEVFYSEHWIDELEICGFEFSWNTTRKRYSLFITVPQESRIARILWLARRSALGSIRAMGSAIRLAGLPVPGVIARFDQIHR